MDPKSAETKDERSASPAMIPAIEESRKAYDCERDRPRKETQDMEVGVSEKDRIASMEEHSRFLREVSYRQKADADQVFFRVAMAGIGLQLTLITAFRPEGIGLMLGYCLSMTSFLAVICLSRKVLVCNAELAMAEREQLAVYMKREDNRIRQSAYETRAGNPVSNNDRKPEDWSLEYFEIATHALWDMQERADIAFKKQNEEALRLDKTYRLTFYVGLIAFVIVALATMVPGS